MTRLADLNADIANMEELRAVMGAMRSLAGMRLQEAQAAISGIRSYGQAVARSVQTAVSLLPGRIPDGRGAVNARALILLTSEHGFVGGFNERLLENIEAASEPDDLLYVLGTRGAALAEERGVALSWTAPMPTRLASAPDAISKLTADLYSRIARNQLARADIVFTRYSQGGPFVVERRKILPFEPESLARTDAGQAPLHNLAPDRLFETLAAEYVFALLTEAAVESIASENAARFAAMDSAHENVIEKLSHLRRRSREARQTEITEELLDVVTGVAALESR